MTGPEPLDAQPADHETERLRREHRALDARILELDRRRHLSGEEALERRRLQKRKLSVRDRLLARGALR
jgi:hypothetical protein